MMYSESEDTLFVHHYAASEGKFGSTTIAQSTDYPADGAVTLQCVTDKPYLALRIPGWCHKFELNLPYTLKDGYAYIAISGEAEVKLTLDMPVVAVAANRQVHDCAGRVAVTRGPLVYCIEGVDNGEDLKSVAIDTKGAFAVTDQEFLLPSLSTTGYRPVESDDLYAPADDACEAFPLRLIPYYAFANRGTTEMHVWLLRK